MTTLSWFKRNRIKRVKADGSYVGVPFRGVGVTITKEQHKHFFDESTQWLMNIGVTGLDFVDANAVAEQFTSEFAVMGNAQFRTQTLRECVALLEQLGNIEVYTTNILNPKAGRFPIKLSQKGGCCDPGTETYHQM